MSKIKLTGESSGYVEISAGNAAGNNTLEAPTSGTRLVAHEGSQDVTLNGNLTVNGVLSYEDVTNIDSVGIITARDGITLKSSVNNQQPKLKIESYGEYGEIKADGNGSLILDADPDFNSNDSYIGFKVDGSEKARITSGGDVGIGDNAPNSSYGTNLSVHSTATDGARLKLSDGSTGKGNTDGLDIISTGSVAYFINRENADMSFSTNNIERLRILNDGKVRLPDNGKLTLGAGDDLQIWSDNTDQYIRGEQNQLILRSNNLKLQSYLGENYIHCAMNNAVSLYYDNSKKLETTSSGVAIHEDTDKVVRFTGAIGEIGDVTGFQGSNTAGNALTDLGMRGTTLRFATGSAERLRINSAGEVYIGSTTANGQGKLFVNDSSGATTTRVHIRNAVSTGNAETYYNLDGIKFASVGLENGSLVFRNSTSSTPTERLRIHSHGQLELTVPDANPALKITPGGTNAPAAIDFNTPGTGVAKLLVQGTERLRITSDGALFVGEYSGSGRFVLHNADQPSGADTTYSKDKGLYVRNDCGPTHVDLTGVDNFTAKIHNGAYAGSGVSDPQGSISKLLFHACTYNGYNAYGAISLDVQGPNHGRGDLVFLNGGNNLSISERLRITGSGTVKINPAELQTTAGDKFANIRGGGIVNTKRFATGHFGNTAAYQPQQLGYIGDYMHYGCNALYYLAQTSTGNSGYSSHMFSWYDSGHWGHYGKFVLMCHEVSYIGGMCHRYLSGTNVSTIFSIGQASSVSTTSTTTGSGTHSGQSVTRYDCTVSHSGTYRTVRWYLGLLHGAQLGVTGNGKSQSDCNTYANSNGSLLHLFGVTDSNLTMAPNYRTW